MTGKRKSRSRNVPHPIVLCDRCKHTFSLADARPPVSFAEQCRAFYTPSNRQRKTIFRERLRLEGVAADYDRELTRLRDIVAQLESRRADVQTHINICVSLSSAPVRRLRNPLSQPDDSLTLSLSLQHDPDKILKRILTFACKRDDDDANSHLQWLTPLVISHVCSHWRKLSLDMPEMWSYLDVTQNLHPDSNLELLHLYIARARRNTPLSVRIELDIHHAYARRHVLNLVLGHAGRWKEAIISVDHGQLWRFLSCPFDILESLVLRIGGIPSDHPIEQFKFVPRLRYVKVGVALGALSLPYGVRCMDLRGRADDSEVVRLGAYQLDAPDLHLSFFPIFTDAPVRLIHLQALTLHALPSNFDTFTQTVTIPFLDRLSIVFGEDYTFDVSSFHSLLSLIKRSKCQLSAFSLDMTQCPGDHYSSHISHIQKLQSGDIVLWDFLDGVSSIRELRVIEPRDSECVHCNMVTMLLRWLVVDDARRTPLILPHLRMLELVWTALPDVDSLKTMVESRAEERVVVRRNTTPVDVEAEEGSRNANEGDETSMSDDSFETCRSSIPSSECDSDDDVIVSPLEFLVIGTRAEIEGNDNMAEWMGELRARGMTVYLW
ncbi:uncharacterized protein EV420DRAFT_1651076 [Desarmillaria tabescens]|uniref:F-box domain-containing protein n=1 Tax=Armillaria tabescens TaxID=1929756 RepID=A0AA39JAK7_ARMTA|nr:uncharacterized protein EV420DRAFT_1651076 [Desarmillaria tabescens]KAK0439236.1 hypothetical protein EV420DRAFT_1651076 [Desarmillaria tabescens]